MSKIEVPVTPSLAIEAREEAQIEHPSEIPTEKPYARPDLRWVGHQLEGLLTFETPLNKLGTKSESAVFEVPLDEEESQNFSLSVELTRIRASLWGQARLRLAPSQLKMKLRSESQLEIEFPKESLDRNSGK